jgi:hypothetical protein
VPSGSGERTDRAVLPLVGRRYYKLQIQHSVGYLLLKRAKSLTKFVY